MAWTTPAHVSGGLASSAQFNEETVDNLQFLYNAMPRSYQQALDAGVSTVGTTELVVATLAIPAQAADMIVVPTAHTTILLNTVTDEFVLRVKETSTAGQIRGSARGGDADKVNLAISVGESFSLPASTPFTLIATLVRELGTGTATTSTQARMSGFLSALLLPSLP